MDHTLVVDVGGQSVKLALGELNWRERLPSGPDLTPQLLIQRVTDATRDWQHRAICLGLPGPVHDNRPTLEPVNLGRGWLGFDFNAHFSLPTRVVNDAAMQALGSYEGGKMLFLGLGTGLGASLVVENLVLSLELAHLPYRNGMTFEDFTGTRGLDRLGRAGWYAAVTDVVERLRQAMVADYVVLGGGAAVMMDPLPPATRLGRNENAILGGQRVWAEAMRIL